MLPAAARPSTAAATIHATKCTARAILPSEWRHAACKDSSQRHVRAAPDVSTNHHIRGEHAARNCSTACGVVIRGCHQRVSMQASHILSVLQAHDGSCSGGSARSAGALSHARRVVCSRASVLGMYRAPPSSRSVVAASSGKTHTTKASHRLAGSAVGAIVAEVITLPTDVAKTRMQVHSHYNGMVDCLRRTASEEGTVALWKGLSPALVRQLCYTCLALVIYEPIRNFYTPSGEPTFLERLAAGGTAGALSITVFNPTEVVKTQMQSSVESKTMAGVTRSVFASRGILGFWAGLQPNIARTFLVNAAELGTYVVGLLVCAVSRSAG